MCFMIVLEMKGEEKTSKQKFLLSNHNNQIP